MSTVENQSSFVANDAPPGDESGVQGGELSHRPVSPAMIRFLGCDSEVAGINADFFTVGRSDDCDRRLPDAISLDPQLVLCFSRGDEGWRVSPPEGVAFYINQERIFGLHSLRSGDVIRLAPGGAGMQFSIAHQDAPSLATLAAKYAPRLLASDAAADASGGEMKQATPSPARPAKPAHPARPVRSEAGGNKPRQSITSPSTASKPTAAKPTAPKPTVPKLPKKGWKLDPAVAIAAVILIAGLIGGAVLLRGVNRPDSSPANLTPDRATPESATVQPDLSGGDEQP